MGTDNATNGNFSEWRRLILHELETLNKGHEELREMVHKMDIRMIELTTELKLKSGIWGAIGAAIPAISAVLFVLFKS